MDTSENQAKPNLDPNPTVKTWVPKTPVWDNIKKKKPKPSMLEMEEELNEFEAPSMLEMNEELAEFETSPSTMLEQSYQTKSLPTSLSILPARKLVNQLFSCQTTHTQAS